MIYTIETIEWHEAELRKFDHVEPDPIKVRWHLTAICALKLGEAHGIDGPADEFRTDDNRVVVRRVERTLGVVRGRHGDELKTWRVEK